MSNEEYIIPLSGLSLGDHSITYTIDDSFFANYDYFDAITGKLNLEVEMIKESSLIDFKFQFTGFFELKCDCCLDKFKLNVEDNFRLIVNFGNEFEEVSDEIITIPYNESKIDLSQYIYEYINLMLPYKKVHPDDEFGNSTCNQEMLDRINTFSEQQKDPRWDALKNIKLD
jgi:uncharacterized metal-binding protein YceD (DUF177 family)